VIGWSVNPINTFGYSGDLARLCLFILNTYSC
jgi:hypothetical protein